MSSEVPQGSLLGFIYLSVFKNQKRDSVSEAYKMNINDHRLIKFTVNAKLERRCKQQRKNKERESYGQDKIN